tara:strand:+ start:851 stop:2008 length:1158 start_codon:yes stop_codon:yes gene_type:complete
MSIFEGGTLKLARSLVTKNRPAYVQFYITARCNLRCEQCNIIYANADQTEATTDECGFIAQNLDKIGTSVVLLTGGEPFARKDLHIITKQLIENNIHPRIQTNGFASYERLKQIQDVGANDISISLDSLNPNLQDEINGNMKNSWLRAIKTITNVNEIFPKNSFCVFGCVLSPKNINQVIPLIEFATEIGWWVSLVPAHVSKSNHPRGFRTYDKKLIFNSEDLKKTRELLDKVKSMKKEGYNLYDSDEYIEDIFRFISKDKIKWREKNSNVCDSPNLYFAILPSGAVAPCCDYRLSNTYYVQDENFPEMYFSNKFRSETYDVVKDCNGCMYGSYPEISISARYPKPLIDRTKLFILSKMSKLNKNVTFDDAVVLSEKISKKFSLS